MSSTISTLQACQGLVPVGNLAAYINWTQSIPVLSKEEEDLLVEKFTNQGDVQAAKQLALAHLRFVVFVSRGFLRYGLPHEDLIQEGNMGLMKAIQRFDPAAGVRLVSFAVYWIKSEIQEFILRNWSIVKLATTKASRKLFFKKHRIDQSMSDEEISHLSEELQVPREDVKAMQIKLNSVHQVVYDTTDQSETPSTAAHYAADSRYSPEDIYMHQSTLQQDTNQLSTALSSLDERSADIIKQRWLTEENKLTLQDLADRYGISTQRVSQLEKAAMAKLKAQLIA
jgi:RNA polymerase sigma-32 factor